MIRVQFGNSANTTNASTAELSSEEDPAGVPTSFSLVQRRQYRYDSRSAENITHAYIMQVVLNHAVSPYHMMAL
jgi:hypothetical protein